MRKHFLVLNLEVVVTNHATAFKGWKSPIKLRIKIISWNTTLLALS